MSKKKKDKALAESVVTTNVVTTRDGETIPVSDAFTLGYTRVLMAKLASQRGPMQGALQSLLDDLRKSPESHAVSSESQHGTTLTEIVEPIKIPEKFLKKFDLTEVPPLWVTLREALEGWEAHNKASKPEEGKGPNAEDSAAKATAAAQAAMDRAAKEAEARKAKAEAQAAAAARLNALSPMAAVKADERAEAHQRHSELEAFLEPLVCGRATVNDNSRPNHLVLGDTELDITHPYMVAESVVDQPDLQNVVEGCVVCQAEHRLGDNYSFHIRGKDKPKTVFYLQFGWFAARTADGLADYVFQKGEKEGDLRKQPLLICNDCVRVCLDISSSKGLAKSVSPNFSSALEQVSRQVLRLREESDARRATSPTLRSSVGERRAAAACGDEDGDEGRNNRRGGRRGRGR